MGRFFEMMPGAVRQAIAYVLLVAIAYADYRTGTEMSIQFFYLIPLTLLAWFGRPLGALILGVVAAGGVLAATLAETGESVQPVTYWNALVACATFIAYALVTATLSSALRRLKELSRTDPLTEIHNRRSFQEAAAVELSRARRSGHSFSLMYLDLDNFKHVNDTRGHDAGDALLRTVSAELRSATRVTDVVARLGGDEFAVLLPETDADGAADVAAKVRSRLQACMNLGAWPVTFSIGVVSCARTPEEVAVVLDAADKLMYSVKKSGKNGLATQTI